MSKKKQSIKTKVITEAELRKREKALEGKFEAERQALIADFNKQLADAQKEFDAISEQVKMEASQDATIVVKAILYWSLHLAYGFKLEDINNLIEIEDSISDGIANGTYSYNELVDDLDRELDIDFGFYFRKDEE